MHHLFKSMRKCLREAISNDGGFIGLWTLCRKATVQKATVQKWELLFLVHVSKWSDV